jgi:hypothetical protein
MKIHSIPHSFDHFAGAGRARAGKHAHESRDTHNRSAAPERTNQAKRTFRNKNANRTDHTEEKSGFDKGVLRNLREGHFKGVADVRLRINFFEAITKARESRARAEATIETFELVMDVGDSIGEMIASGELNEEQVVQVTELRAGFEARVETLTSDFRTGDIDGDALVAGLRDAFDGLSASLETMFTPEPPAGREDPPNIKDDPLPEQPVAAPAETDAPVSAAATPDATETVADWEASTFLAALSEKFESGIKEIVDALEVRPLLPDLSGPRGRGRAFQKFLLIYQMMQRGSEPQEPLGEPEQTQDPPVNTKTDFTA